MAKSTVAFLLFGVAAVLAFPQGKESMQPQHPDSIELPSASSAVQVSEDSKVSHPEWIPWPPAEWFPEDAPGWWPQGWDWPPRPSHPEWIPWPPTHPESIPWPPAGWFPEDAPGWWPEGWEWPPRPSLPEGIPWPPTHPESIPWPPTHPESIPWPPSEWFPEDAPGWWPEGWEWPPRPSHPEWIPWPPQHPEWIPWPPQHPEWIPWPPQHPDWAPNAPYIPSRDNRFHLFSRQNPSLSQPIIYQNSNMLASSNFDSAKRTIVLIHGMGGSATDHSNAILVPAFLAAGDVNVIIVDWSQGANSATALSTVYSVLSGRFISNFISWVVEASNADLADFHLVGFGIGGLNAGFIGRLLGSKVGYITALDPSQGPAISSILPPLNPNVALYTEVIHTDAGGAGYAQPLGDVDFYPNGGQYMPGCGGDSTCNRLRSVYYFAESLQGGRFTGVQCENHAQALEGQCNGPKTLKMGGLEPKTGSSGVFHLTTNAGAPFARG